MLETGFIAGLIAKLVALGSAAKIGVATTTAALTVTAATAGGVLVVRTADSDPAATPPGVTQGAVAHAAAVPDPTTPTTLAEAGTTPAGTSQTTPAGSIRTAPSTEAALTTPSLATPSLPIPVPSLPDLSALTQLPAQVLACLQPVFALVAGLPAVSPAQISGIGPSIVGCVTGIVQGLPLPFGLNACISEILGFVGDMASQLPSGIPDFGGLDLAACIPNGLPVPTVPSGGGFPFGGGGFSGGGFPFGR